jgi:hypothetical protein
MRRPDFLQVALRITAEFQKIPTRIQHFCGRALGDIPGGV